MRFSDPARPAFLSRRARFSGFSFITSLLLLALAPLGISSLRAQDYAFSTIGGVAAFPGSTNGTSGGANLPLFDGPIGLVVNKDGNLYVADSKSHMIRVVTPGGEVTSLAGTPGVAGRADGTGVDNGVYFSSPQAPAIDSAGNLYVADYTLGTIRKITPAGVVTTIAGSSTYIGSGSGTVVNLGTPTGIAINSVGTIYVANSTDNTIHKITAAGVASILAGKAGTSGATNGTGETARFNKPRDLVCDSAGNVYVADYNNNLIRKVTPEGVVTTYAGIGGLFGTTDGDALTAKFNFPHGLAIDSTGNLYVADSANHAIRKITPAGQVSTLAGAPGQAAGLADGSGNAARFNLPTDVAVDPSGNVYVTDYENQLIRKITPAGVVTTVAGVGKNAGILDGDGYILSPALFSNPSGASIDAAGNLFIADTGNNMVRKIAPAGDITSFAGNPLAFGRTDGTGTAATFTSPADATADMNGNVYVADTANHTIRKITSAGVVTTFAGTAGTIGSADGTGTAATFNYPGGITSDASGNLYVADYDNHTIRKISSTGVVTTFAGSAGSSGSTDGTGSTARFNHPRSVAVDAAGYVYVADSGNHAIRKISSGGVVQTLAGSSGSSGTADGTGTTARFNGPTGITVDAAGTVYVSDSNNNTIRKITPAGVVTTIGGTAGTVGNRDGIGTAARFDRPAGLTVDAAGILYIADSRNHTIRKGIPANASSSGTGISGNSNSPTTGSNTNNTGGSNDTAGGDNGSGSGTGTGFLLQPGGVLWWNSSAYMVCDTANNSIKLVNLNGTVEVIAGKDGSAGSTDGKGTDARFNGPTGITQNTNGDLYICDTGNATIRKIARNGDVTTIAGSPGSRGTTDGTGSAALFSSPTGIVYNTSTDELFVSDSVNCNIRKITTAGVVTTYAGTARVPGDTDGPATNALFNNPMGLTLDQGSNLYIADTFNNTIRMINTVERVAAVLDPVTDQATFDSSGNQITRVTRPVNTVTTLAGSAGISGANDGTGIYGLFNRPTGLSIDKTTATVFVADSGNSLIRSVTPRGVVSTVAGIAGISGKRDGANLSALFNQPQALSLATSSFIVADTGNSVLRSITYTTGNVSTLALKAASTTGSGTGSSGGSSGGGGGGGGAPSLWFCAALSLLSVGRAWIGRKRS